MEFEQMFPKGVQKKESDEEFTYHEMQNLRNRKRRELVQRMHQFNEEDGLLDDSVALLEDSMDQGEADSFAEESISANSYYQY